MKINCTHGVVDEHGNHTQREWTDDVPADYFTNLMAAARTAPTPQYMDVPSWLADMIEDELAK